MLPASRRSFGLPSKIEKGASIKLDADGKPQIAGMAPDLLAAYQKELARPYPRAVAGDIEYMSFDQDTAVFELRFSPRDAPVGGPAAVRGEDTAGDTTGDTELFLSPLVYPNTAWNVTTLPADCCTVTPVANGVTLRVVKAAPNGVTVKVGPK